MKRYIILLILAFLMLFKMLYHPLVKRSFEGKANSFSDYPVGQEYAMNRDGYIIKVSDHIAIMKLYNDLDEVMYIDNSYGDGLQGKIIIKGEIIDYDINPEDIALIIDHNGETEIINLPK